MFYLFLNMLTSTAILVAFKLFPRYKVNVVQAITVNYVVAVAAGLLLSGETLSAAAYIHKPWFPLSLLVGVTFIAVFFLFAESAVRAGVALTSVAAKMSVVIPVMLGFFLFHDRISALKVLGILAALLAFYLTFKKEGKLALRWHLILFPFLIFLGNGMNDSLMKIVQHYHIRDDFEQFLTVVFAVALVCGLLASFFRKGEGQGLFTPRNLIAGLILGILNWYSTYSFIAGMQFFDVSVFVPLVNVSVVTLSSLTGYLAFRERLSRVNWAGIILAMAAIVLIAFS